MSEQYFSMDLYRQHQEKLVELVRMPHVTSDTIQEAIRAMCKVVAKLVAVDSVSVWHYDLEQEAISCQVAYTRESSFHYPELTIPRTLAPDYFDALQKNRVLTIEDVQTHPWVKSLYEHYTIEDKRIHSMLDAPIYANERIQGVLCCETFAPRAWTHLEELVITTLTDFIAILYFRLDRQEIDLRLHRLAYTDDLTGMMNRHSFLEEIDRLRQTNDRPGSLLYIQVDDFRSIEDAVGWDQSDALVCDISRRLSRRVDYARISRISQAGFAIWTPYANRDEVLALAHRLCESVTKESFFVDELEVLLTMSAFISVEQPERSTLEMIHTTRIVASEHSQQRGEIAFYEEEMGMKATARLTLEMNLRTGIANREFELFYQPKVDGSTGKLKGFEGLMRWRHPEKGLIPPLDFIPLAESTGMILDLETWAFVTACRQLKTWHDRGLRYELALNLSARHFLSDGIVEKFVQIAREEGISPHFMTLEITESVGMKNQQHVINRFIAFREQGFSISIDDFGTGFSAFVYLKHYPVHEIKIDRQFIQTMDHDSKGSVIIQSIVDLARGLNLKTVCEGIETKEQYEALRTLGCDEMQGYYFSRPLPLDELETWIGAYQQ